MKKILKMTAIVLGFVVLVILTGALFINFRGIPTYEVRAPELKVTMDSASIARGEHLVSMICADCHRGEGGKLVGKEMTDIPEAFGKVWSKNITNHPTKGLGRYTDGEIAYLLRTGIKRNGQYAPPYMDKFPHMSDRDLHSIIAYLRSDAKAVQAEDVEQPECQPSFLTKLLCNLVFRPLPYPDAEIKMPSVTDKVAYGRYIATAAVGCYGCHSADFKTMDIMNPEKTPGFMGGGNTLIDSEGKEVLSANLTMHKENGIGSWKEEEFAKAVRFGQRPDGRPLSDAMPKFSPMTDEEISAIWAWLQTVPVQENEVARAGMEGKME